MPERLLLGGKKMSPEKISIEEFKMHNVLQMTAA